MLPKPGARIQLLHHINAFSTADAKALFEAPSPSES